MRESPDNLRMAMAKTQYAIVHVAQHDVDDQRPLVWYFRGVEQPATAAIVEASIFPSYHHARNVMRAHRMGFGAAFRYVVPVVR